MGTILKKKKQTSKNQPFTSLQRGSRKKHLSKLTQCSQLEERNQVKSLLIAGLVLGLRHLQMKEILLLKF